MLKRMLHDGTVYSISSFLGRGIALILVPFYTKVFSPTDYGIIDIFSVVASLTFLIVALEISQSVARFYPELEDLNTKKSYASTALIFTIISYLIFGFLMFSFADFIGHKILDKQYFKSLYSIAIIQIVIAGISRFLINQLRLQFRSKTYALVNITNLVVTSIAAIYLVLVIRIGVIGTFYAALIGSSSTLILAFSLSTHDYGLVFSKKKLVEMLRFSLPFVPSSIAVFLSLFTDRIMIKEMLSLNELGLYGIAFRFSSIIIVLVSGFRTALSPLIYKYYKRESTKLELSKLLNIFVFFGGLFVSLMFLFPKEILQLLTSSDYIGAWKIIGILTLIAIISNLYIFTPGASIAKKTIHLLLANLIGASSNVIFNYLLIPVFGVFGAAIGTLISAILVFIYYLTNSQRYYRIPFQTIQLIKFILVFLILIGFSVTANIYFSTSLGMIALKTIILVIFSVLSLKLLITNWKDYFFKIRSYIIYKLT